MIHSYDGCSDQMQTREVICWHIDVDQMLAGNPWLLTGQDFVYRLGNSDNLLLTIQEKIKWADSMSDQDRRHKKEVEDKAEEIRKTIKVKPHLRSIAHVKKDILSCT